MSQALAERPASPAPPARQAAASTRRYNAIELLDKGWRYLGPEIRFFPGGSLHKKFGFDVPYEVSSELRKKGFDEGEDKDYLCVPLENLLGIKFLDREWNVARQDAYGEMAVQFVFFKPRPKAEASPMQMVRS